MDTKVELLIKRKCDLDALLSFLKSTSIEIINVKEPEQSDPIFTQYNYIPTPEFKRICGSEYLNSKGHISIQSAFQYIINYARINELINEGNIELDAYLKDALHTDLKSINMYKINSFLMKLFKKV
jgi:hypothetical protein